MISMYIPLAVLFLPCRGMCASINSRKVYPIYASYHFSPCIGINGSVKSKTSIASLINGLATRCRSKLTPAL